MDVIWPKMEATMKFPLLITIPVPWHSEPIRIHVSLTLSVIILAVVTLGGVAYFY
jgi:hypothetical protein